MINKIVFIAPVIICTAPRYEYNAKVVDEFWSPLKRLVKIRSIISAGIKLYANLPLLSFLYLNFNFLP